MSTMTRQDLFTATELAKNKIIERLVTKYDVQTACDSVKNKIMAGMQTMQMENQAMIRQINAQQDQSWRKVNSLENQVTSLQREVRELSQLLKVYLGESEDYSQDSASELPAALPVK